MYTNMYNFAWIWNEEIKFVQKPQQIILDISILFDRSFHSCIDGERIES